MNWERMWKNLKRKLEEEKSEYSNDYRKSAEEDIKRIDISRSVETLRLALRDGEGAVMCSKVL